ncbi:MAG: FAD:protein FMN transferase [Planctomycetota bacterium]|nr:hypothetical protein [Planctomycetota bacterium]MDP6519481.1 FAD:protein FMN transferase [Planctomycetota bacterium]MDP6839875.1 FAD:protein FMN transferase [Planctomycetota bacterium]
MITAHPTALRLAVMAMGTRFELVLPSEGDRSTADLRAAGEAALLEIEEADKRLSLFRADSLLSLVNRRAFARPVGLDGETLELLTLALGVYSKSRGVFDITVAPLMGARGLHGAGSSAAPGRRVAGSGAIILDQRAGSVRFTDPACALDLGAIAKGHALDLAARSLGEEGVQRALLHGGTSTVLALAPPEGQDAWRISLAQAPDAAPVELCQGALSVSSGAGRLAPDGSGHVLDPRTGQAVATDAFSAVLAPSATLADAWSTALLVEPDLDLGSSPISPIQTTALTTTT